MEAFSATEREQAEQEVQVLRSLNHPGERRLSKQNAAFNQNKMRPGKQDVVCETKSTKHKNVARE
jgi:hypothetical protein